ncbi:MAG: hypothetical protein K2I63_04540, partial [Helicobacter sp.]|nr:hypothetical protein [Helicobacter sp.]
NARKIIAAAMAPSDPIPQDYKVAASAMQMENAAKIELSQEYTREIQESLKQSIQNSQQKYALLSYQQNLQY